MSGRSRGRSLIGVMILPDNTPNRAEESSRMAQEGRSRRDGIYPRPGSLKGRDSAPQPSSAAVGWHHPGPINRRAGLHGTYWPFLLAFPPIPLSRVRQRPG